MQQPIGITCQQLVELLTDYLEDALPTRERALFEQHLGVCPGCVDYLEQMRHTIRAAGALDEQSLAPGVRDALLEAFRDWRAIP